ncbi:MAG: putative beta-lactamase [Paenibacillus sp.]|nr:putative beta-lactamase [Paenibacillus sp.]
MEQDGFSYRFRDGAEAACMDAERIGDAFRLLDDAIARGLTPGGVALIGRHGRVAAVHAAGAAHTATPDGADISVQPDTIYDCASLTKIVVTLPLILRLVDRGLLRLGDPVAEYIPAFAASGKEAVTVKQLLAHTSGLAAHARLYEYGGSADERKAALFALPLDYEPGTRSVYSCLGFITLGEIAAALYGKPLDAAAQSELFAPLGMRDSGFAPAAEQRPRIAATEYSAHLGRHKWGEVHDENAASLDGVSGNAGLFATAGDLARYAAMWLSGGRTAAGEQLLSGAAVRAAVRCQTPGLAEPANRGLGWVLRGDPWDASGDLLSPACYGHTGFTGTSLWIDPELDCFAVLLTNRVHFGRDKSVVRLRACFHNAVAAACLQ